MTTVEQGHRVDPKPGPWGRLCQSCHTKCAEGIAIERRDGEVVYFIHVCGWCRPTDHARFDWTAYGTIIPLADDDSYELPR
ncbi:MAG: hypothetical protein ABFR89_02595 [Actinomycetota bacterium]